MRSRELKAMVRELEGEERELVENLTKVRTALEYLRARSVAAEAAEAMQTVVVTGSLTGETESVALWAPRALRNATMADLIDHVLSAQPADAREISRRIRALPEAPEVKEDTVRWNLSNKWTERGWLRSGTKASALWSKHKPEKTAAQG